MQPLRYWSSLNDMDSARFVCRSGIVLTVAFGSLVARDHDTIDYEPMDLVW